MPPTLLLGNHEVMNMAGDLRFVTKEDFASFHSHSNRSHVFSEQGWIGSWLRTLPIVAIVDDTVFMHGGLRHKYAKLGIEEINKRATRAITNQAWYHEELLGNEGPLWYRGYAIDPERWGEKGMCHELEQTLQVLGVKRMVLGHTPQVMFFSFSCVFNEILS